RTPPGTRAVGWFTVSKNDDDYFTHVREIHIQVGDDPRAVGGPCWFPWFPPRGSSRSEAALLEYVLQEVIKSVEERKTAAGHQRFRVVRAAWQDATRRGKRRGAPPAETLYGLRSQ